MAEKAVIYARFSSHNQNEQSIDGQLKSCYDYATAHDIAVIGTYIDRAISGKTDERPEFQRMISDSAKRQFDTVLVYQFDRFARNQYDGPIYKKKLKDNGVTVVSAMEPISDDATGVLLEALLEGIAAYYSVELKQKVKRGMEQNLLKGKVLGGQTPLGFRIENQKYVIDDETAPVVQSIFAMYITGKTMAEIIDYLNRNGIKTKKGNNYDKNSIRRILTNKRYIGSYVHNGVEYPNKMPAIVDKDTFEQVQVVMQKNKKAPARAKAVDERYILTTKLYCGHCKSPMTGLSGYSKNGTPYQYYGCAIAQKRKGECLKRNVRKDFIEDAVIRVVRNVLSDENIDLIADALIEIEKRENDNGKLKALVSRLNKVHSAQKNLLLAIENGQGIDLLSEQLSKRQEEAKLLEAEIAREKLYAKRTFSKDDAVIFLRKIRSGEVTDIVYRQSMIDAFVDAIYLYDDDTKDGKNKHMNILLRTKDGQKEIPIDDTECSSMGKMVEN